MKIKVLSDLHLEFGGFDPGEGEVLVLAGDILVVNDIAKESPQGKYYRNFLKKCSKNYEKVFYVLGNHEYYHGDFQEVEQQLRAVLPENITVLQNQSEVYDGVTFVGATLWTDHNEGDPNSKLLALGSMNDYYSILNGEWGQLNVTDTIEAHEASFKYLSETIDKAETPVVVITHHAPSLKSLGTGGYVHDDIKYAYASNLEPFIEKHTDKIQYWIHGHIHESNDYTVANTHIVSNPRGYCDYQENTSFDKELELIVSSQKTVQPV